jgi:D-3-phosphoglycerate dehydrogenase / 2-oxoglutarate reductase
MTEPVEAPVEALVLDLLEWVAIRERGYDEVMSAWRTSCPRLPVWEDANDRGLIGVAHANGGSVVRITPEGLAFLQQRRPSPRSRGYFSGSFQRR